MTFGIGIRRNGLNMISCNAIFWYVIEPILTFENKVWIMSVKEKETIISFLRYGSRQMQRLPQRSLNLRTIVLCMASLMQRED